MAAAVGLARVSATIPQRFYDGDSGKDSKVSRDLHGRQYDHVQAWVNSLPQPPAPPQHSLQQKQLLQLQQQQRPEAAEAASFASRPQAPSERGTQPCQQPAGLDYVQAGLQRDRNLRGRQSTIGSGGCREQSGRRDRGSLLLLMKANHCSLSSSDASSSVEDILNERKGNPEELLRLLGFGSHSCSLASRLPARFLLNPSKARGVQTDAIIAMHPELLALKEPKAAALSATMLDKLPNYYQRGIAPGAEANAFSSLHRRFSEKLSAAGEAALLQQQQQRWEGASVQRRMGGNHFGGSDALTSLGFAGPPSSTGQKEARDGAAVLRTGFMHAATRADAADRSGISAQKRDVPAAAKSERMTASLSSLSDSVFMSNSDGAGDDCSSDFVAAAAESTYDLDKWPFDYPDISARLSDLTGSGGGGSRRPLPLRRTSSYNDDGCRADGGGRGGRSRRGAAAALEKQHSLDTLNLTDAQRPPAAGGALLPRLSMPVTVLVTSDDGELMAGDAPDGGSGGLLPPSAGRLLVGATGRRSPSAGSRTPTPHSPSPYLSVVDSFESGGESDTQTITGDVPDECPSGGGTAAGLVGGGASGVGGHGGRGLGMPAEDVAASSAAAEAAGASRLLLAVVPAMESFEMEEIQSVGDPTRPRSGGGAVPMPRSQSAQSDSSGFADTEDERPLRVSPPTTCAEDKEVPAAGGDPATDRRCMAGFSHGINKMADGVDVLLNLSARRKRLVLSREPNFQEAMSPDSAPDMPGLVSLSSAEDSAATAAPLSASDRSTTEDEYSSALDTLERASSSGLQSECDEPELVACERPSELQTEAVSTRHEPGSARSDGGDSAAGWWCDGTAVATQRRVTGIRSGPLAEQRSTVKEGSVASVVAAAAPHVRLPSSAAPPLAVAAAVACRQTGSPCKPGTCQCAVELNVALSTPDMREAVCGAPHAVKEAHENRRAPCALERFVPDDGAAVAVVVTTTESFGGAERPTSPRGSSRSAAAIDGLPTIVAAAAPHDHCRGCSGGSEVSGRARSLAADTSSSAVLQALLRPAACVATGAASEGDMRLVQRAVKRYRAAAYETDAVLDARIQSIPVNLRDELQDELQSLEDVRQSAEREAVQLEAHVLERLDATRMPKSVSRCSSPLLAFSSLPPSQGSLLSPSPLRPPSAAGSGCLSRRSPAAAGAVEECTKLLKEQIYQQKLLESKGGLASAAASVGVSGCAAAGSTHQEVASLQHQVNLLETKQKYEQRIAELEVTTLKLMLQAKEEEIKRLKLLTDID